MWLRENARLFMHEGCCLQQLLGGDELENPLHSHVSTDGLKFGALGGSGCLQPANQLCPATLPSWPFFLGQGRLASPFANGFQG